jgi:putative drug exporter of the RND superfamily
LWSSPARSAADRHFSQARINPDILMVESDHDMRNPADMLVLDRVAKNVVRTVGIAMIQDITRPLGIPIQHSSIPFQNSMQSQLIMQNMAYLKDRMADIHKMADEMGVTINLMQQMYGVMQQLTDTTHHLAADSRDMTEITDQLRDHIADFDDFWRPIRSYFYWEKHCFDIPICWSFRSLFDSLDGIDQLDEKLHDLTKDVDRMDSLMSQMLALIPPMINSMKTTRDLTLTTYSTFAAMINQMEAMDNTPIAMGQSFDTSKNDDFF